jgi:hypothetical protein
MITGKKRNIFLYLFLLMVTIASLLIWKFLIYLEPPFVVLGDRDILAKLHVNVYMFRYQGGSSLNTVFLNGKLYEIDNTNVDRFEFYINYDGRFFFHYGYDNVPRMVGDAGSARNTLLFCRFGQEVFFSNRSTKCSEMKDGSKLLSLDDVIGKEILDNKQELDITDKSTNEFFILHLKKSFFEITKPVS